MVADNGDQLMYEAARDPPRWDLEQSDGGLDEGLAEGEVAGWTDSYGGKAWLIGGGRSDGTGHVENMVSRLGFWRFSLGGGFMRVQALYGGFVGLHVVPEMAASMEEERGLAGLAKQPRMVVSGEGVGLVSGLASPARISGDLLFSGGSGLSFLVLLRAGGRSESGLACLGLLANLVVGARDGQGMGLEQLGVMGGGFATHGGGGNGGGDRVQAVKGGIAGSGVGMGGMNNDGGGVLDRIGVVGGRGVVGWIARRKVGRHGEGGRLDARLVVNDGGGGGGYLA